jgi:hypothetical protein
MEALQSRNFSIRHFDMKNIFRQLGIMVGFLGIFYLFFLVLTYVLYPDTTIDNNNPTKSFFNFYQPPPQNLTLKIWGIKFPSLKRVFIMGSSDVYAGFSPSEFQKALPEYSISSLAMSDSNFTQLKNIFDVIQMSSVGSMKDTVFIVGLWYTQFSDAPIPDRSQSQDTNLTQVEAEALRYGLYRVKNDELEPVFDPHSMRLAVDLLRPILLCHVIFLNVNNLYGDFWIWMHQLRGESAVSAPMPIQEGVKQAALMDWAKRSGNINDYMEGGVQVQKFLDLCGAITRSGASLVLVDMPVPQWHRERSIYYKKYALRKSFYLDQILKMPKVQYIDLSSYFPDSDFIDSAHPTEQGTKDWSRVVARWLRPRL